MYEKGQGGNVIFGWIKHYLTVRFLDYDNIGVPVPEARGGMDGCRAGYLLSFLGKTGGGGWIYICRE